MIAYRTLHESHSPQAPWRDYKLRASRILAGKVDDSASSLADAQIDADMGGALGPPLPPAGNADGRTMDGGMDGAATYGRTKRNKVLFEWWTRHLASQTVSSRDAPTLAITTTDLKPSGYPYTFLK